MKGLSDLIQDVHDVISQKDLTIQEKTRIEERAGDCKEYLQKLESFLNDYQEIDPNATRQGSKIRMVWTKFKWDEKAIEEHRQRVIRSINAFTLVLNRISL